MSEAEGVTYAIRLHSRARLDIDEVQLRLAELSGDKNAAQWAEGLLDAMATLSSSPRRCPRAREDALFQREVRQLLYRRRSSKAVYRILFAIVEHSDEAPFVFVLHVRHGAQAPITADEAQSIEETD